MSDDAIRNSFENKRLKLSIGQLESHYSIVVVFFMPCLIILFVVIKDWISGTSTVVDPDFYYVIVGGILLGIISFLFQRRRLRLTELDINPTEERFHEFLKKIEEKEDWFIFYKSERAIIIKTYPKLTSGSWGEQITILRDGNRTFLNSICDPDKHSSIFSAGRNSANIKGIRNFFERPDSKRNEVA